MTNHKKTASNINDKIDSMSVDEMKAALSKAWTGASHDLHDKAHEVGKQIRSYAGQAAGRLGDFEGDLESRISEEPLKAGIALLAVGFLLGLLTTRR